MQNYIEMHHVESNDDVTKKAVFTNLRGLALPAGRQTYNAVFMMINWKI